ncbi:MAG: hypothetical protein J5802_10390 [Butyrivibrio sp.]|nr:hypothetical protein [Butyrivibrio sp.]
MLLLVFTTGCGVATEKNPTNLKSVDEAVESNSNCKNKLIEEGFNYEINKDYDYVQVCVYNDVFMDHGKEKNNTFIDISKDNEVKETINTYSYLDQVTEISCFDFNIDEMNDIAVIGYSGSEIKVFLYEATSDYHFNVYSGWNDVADIIKESLHPDFDMKELKNILVKRRYNYAMSMAEETTYSDYTSAYIDWLRILRDCEFDEDGRLLACYYLYDIDKDATPELLVKYGNDAVSTHIRVYTYADDKIQRVEGNSIGNEALYAYPSGNGIMEWYSHMGANAYILDSLINNELTSESLYLAWDDNHKTGEECNVFKEPKEVVTDTFPITSFKIDDVYPIGHYEKVLSDMAQEKVE